MDVFATQGVDATVIDDLIVKAQVSRGTFYNYFRTTEEVMVAVMQIVGNELLSLVDAAIADRTDPAERLACGVRMVLQTARHFPHVGRFMSQAGATRSLDQLPALGNLLRDLIESHAAEWHLNALAVTDAFLVFAMGLIVMQRVEMYIRARRIQSGGTDSHVEVVA